MPITREEFEKIRNDLGAHTSWAIWAPAGERPKSNVGDLSIFNEEYKIKNILNKLNPNIILAGLNGANGEGAIDTEVRHFANFHSHWHRATDFKIRYATEGTALEGAFMTDVIKHHYETDSNLVAKRLRDDPSYEKLKLEEFFDEITKLSRDPTIFAFGGQAYNLIQKHNRRKFKVFKLFHYAFTMSKERFREETLKTLHESGFSNPNAI